MALVLTNASLIDCVRPDVARGARMTIEHGRIVEVSDGSSPIARDAQVIDLEDAYLLPGLWDVHVHLDWRHHGSGPRRDRACLKIAHAPFR